MIILYIDLSYIYIQATYYPVIRRAIRSGWYAFHDTNPPEPWCIAGFICGEDCAMEPTKLPYSNIRLVYETVFSINVPLESVGHFWIK